MKFLIFLLLLINSQISQALNIPRITGPVTDQAGLLSSQVSDALSRSLYNLKQTSGSEIAVLSIKSLEGESIEGYAIRVVDEWKLGSKNKDNGVLFLIALDEKLMRIEVGQGHEGDLPDARAGHIINNVKTYFKRGDFQSGVILGVDLIAKSIGANLSDVPKVAHKGTQTSGGSLLFLIFVIIAFIFGRRGGGGGLLAGALLGSAMGGKSSRSSYRGGSFGGGGGGFSGGGASGGW